MMKKECIAMLLAGGQGSRLGALTKHIAKPGVSFGGKYRIIDFALSNCMNSGIDTVGIMTQYRPLLLNSYIGTGAAWDMDIPNGGITVLPPYATSSSFKWYQGTADAVYQNIDYINQYNPEYVLILSGDHLYRMDYSAMLEEHKKNNADLTISVIEVPWKETNRFGIMTANEEGRVVKFSEKPANPDSNLASMGIYIFNWNVLKKALTEDHSAKQTAHDFGKNVIPKLLDEGKNLFTYEFNGYWKDIGTIDSYYDACMELLDPSSDLGLFNPYEGRIMSNLTNHAPAYIGPSAKVKDSIVCTGCEVFGEIEHSIISIDVVIGEGSKIKNSIVLPGVRIGKDACIENAIVAENVKIGENVNFGSKEEISVAGDDLEEAK